MIEEVAMQNQKDNELYQICWYYNSKPAKLFGGSPSNDKDMLELWVEEGNKKWPMITHWVEKIT